MLRSIYIAVMALVLPAGFLYAQTNVSGNQSGTWRGTANTAWENPANWSCGVIPDGFTDVIIPTGSNPLPVVNSNAACRSLMLKPGTSLTVVSGFNLKIKGK